MFQNRIRLDDLLGRDLTVQWFEGVAVVQSVCRQILAASPDRPGFPSAGDILLGVGGTIEVLNTPGPTAAVASAGHLLAQMLGEDAPVRLRLVATQATGGGSGYATLDELTEVLTYFERPHADVILAALYARAVGARSRGYTVPPAAPVLQMTDHPEEQHARSGTARRALIAAGIAGTFVCGGIWLFAFGSEGPAAAAVTALGEKVRAVLRQLPSNETIELEAEVPKPDPTIRNSRVRRPSKTPGNIRSDGNLASLWLAPLTRELPQTWTGPDILPIPDASYEVPAFGVPVTTSGRALYSGSNTDVLPPRSVYPKLPANPPSGVRLADDTVLELVIGTDGLVERVRLRTEPRNVHEFMLVSAAKAWQFEPATLRGRPVRYLHTVTLSLH